MKKLEYWPPGSGSPMLSHDHKKVPVSSVLLHITAKVLLMNHQGPRYEESKITLLLKLGENKVDLLDVKKETCNGFCLIDTKEVAGIYHDNHFSVLVCFKLLIHNPCKLFSMT